MHSQYGMQQAVGKVESYGVRGWPPHINILRNMQGIARDCHTQSNPGILLGAVPRDTEGCIGEACDQLDRDGAFGISADQQSAITFRKLHRVGAILAARCRQWRILKTFSAVHLTLAGRRCKG